MQSQKQTIITLLMVLAALLLAACGGAARAAQVSRVTIKAHDYRFEAPAQIEAGLVLITLENEGDGPHHVQLVRLNDEVSPDQFQTALQQGPEAAFPLVTWAGGPGVIDPGGQQTVTVELTPGHYVLLSFVPDHEGVPHLAKGMVAPLEVVAPAEPATVQRPKADATIQLDDFAFILPLEVKAGPQVWQIENKGEQPHEIALIKLAEGKSIEDVAAFMQAPHGAPPFSNAGGLQAIDPGETGWLNLNLESGTYVALCHVPDPASGKPHEMLGMVLPFVVK